MPLPVLALPSWRKVLNIMLSVSVVAVSISVACSESVPQNFSKLKERSQYMELLKKLFPEDFDPSIPPASAGIPIDISMDLVIDSLTDLDMKSQTLTVSVWFQIKWQDELMTWDINQYPIRRLVVNEKRLWRPTVAVFNSLSCRDQLMKVELPLVLSHSGNIGWYPGDTLELNCPVRLWHYPFDEQTCLVRIVQWGDMADLVNCSEASVASAVVGNGEWDIVDMTWDRVVDDLNGIPYWEIAYSITLKRKWLFYAINVIFPIVLVSGLNCLVFMLPVQGSEKMSVSVTNFLTLAVFMTMIQDMLPMNSDTICYLSMYLAMQLTLGALAVVLSAVQVSYHHKLEKAAAKEGYSDSTQDGQALKKVCLDEPREDSTTLEETETGNDWFVSNAQRQNTRASQKQEVTRKFWGLTWKPRFFYNFKGRKSATDSKTDLSTRMDAICFPIFVTLNVLSLLTYCFIIMI